jgi:hypothetical protein
MTAKTLTHAEVKRFAKWHERHVRLVLRDLELKLQRGVFAMEHAPNYVAFARRHLCQSLLSDVRALCGEKVTTERTKEVRKRGKAKAT